jgi:hypothetical protein
MKRVPLPDGPPEVFPMIEIPVEEISPALLSISGEGNIRVEQLLSSAQERLKSPSSQLVQTTGLN